MPFTEDTQHIAPEAPQNYGGSHILDALNTVSLESLLDSPNSSDTSFHTLDALLGLTTTTVPTKKGLETLLKSTMSSFDRFPALHTVCDRFLQLSSASLHAYVSKNTDFTLHDIKAHRFGDFLNTLPLPTMIGGFTVPPLTSEMHQGGLLIFDHASICTILDTLLGGADANGTRMNKRSYTSVDRDLIHHVMTLFLNDLQKAFSPFYDLRCVLDAIEYRPQLSVITKTTNPCVVMRLNLFIDGVGGIVTLLIPHETLDPISDALNQHSTHHTVEWQHALNHHLWHTHLDIDVCLGHTTLTLNDVLQWQPGDHILFSTTAHDVVSGYSSDLEVFKAHVGYKNNHVAVEIDTLNFGGSHAHS